MKSDSAPVKSRVNNETVTIGMANFPVYDNIDEAVAGEGEEKCLQFINSQTKTNEMNKMRALHRGGPSKGKLQRMAIAETTTAEWAEVACDEAKIDALLKAKSSEIEARMATIAAEAVPVED